MTTRDLGSGKKVQGGEWVGGFVKGTPVNSFVHFKKVYKILTVKKSGFYTSCSSLCQLPFSSKHTKGKITRHK